MDRFLIDGVAQILDLRYADDALQRVELDVERLTPRQELVQVRNELLLRTPPYDHIVQVALHAFVHQVHQDLRYHDPLKVGRHALQAHRASIPLEHPHRGDERCPFPIARPKRRLKKTRREIKFCKEFRAFRAEPPNERSDVGDGPALGRFRRRVDRAIIDAEAELRGSLLGDQEDLRTRDLRRRPDEPVAQKIAEDLP